jgi:hypothetical protein
MCKSPAVSETFHPLTLNPSLCRWQKALPVAEKPSKVLNPQNPITAADFDTLILELNEKIENENAKMAPASTYRRKRDIARKGTDSFCSCII